MDALAIACAGRNHINYLNNEYAKSDKKDVRFELRNKLRRLESIEITDKKTGNRKKIQVAKEFLKPWGTFTEDAKNKLLCTLVSFKQNLRVINRTVNHYQKWVTQKDGTIKKEFVKQIKGDSWAIRKPMHKDTVSGLVQLRSKKTVSLASALDIADVIVEMDLRKKIKELAAQNFDKKKIQKFFKDNDNKWNEKDLAKVEVFYWEKENVASRVKLDDSFNSDKIESITDTGIRSILVNHLRKYNEEKDGKTIEHPELAFSPEGIDELNNNLSALNKGKLHQPIYKVRTYEPKGNKFNVGNIGNKQDKFVEAAKGTNLFFAVYSDADGKRSYDTIPLNIVIERQKQGLSSVPEKNERDNNLIFHLSPNDLVYVPTKEESENPTLIDIIALSIGQQTRIYKFVSCTGNEGHFVPNSYSAPIIKSEIGSNNKNQNTIQGIQIKSLCWKLITNRTGRVTSIYGV